MLTRTLFGVETLALGVETLRRAGRRVHELNYPDLIADPAAELAAVCDFLGVKYDAQMLDLAHADFSMVPAGEHHARVRSGSVCKDTPPAEVLPAELVAKGGRYAQLWRERFAHLKLAQVLPVVPNLTKPDEAERLGDWLAMWFWRSLLLLKHFVFAHIPLAAWARLREREQGRSILNEMSRASSAPTPFVAPAGPAARHLTFSIITPSFRNSDWLKLCLASVADQTGVELEHIVQDSCSDDGTAAWLPHDPRVKAFIEKDAGMYDAVNRGYRRATGDILAYLNCDEQYLPGALAAVRDYFETHPQVEVLLAGSIITDGAGQYICHRQLLAPNARHIWFRFPFLTSSVFLRRRVISERGLFFDTRWRDLGDFHWAISLLQNRVSIGVSDVFTSTFADTGENMNMKPNALREKAETEKMIPAWLRPFKPFWILSHLLRRFRAGHFRLGPTSYAIYTKQSPGRRVTIDVPRPTAVWWNRM
jgi:glycosyltransferase involved in cell wall biosynthesis